MRVLFALICLLILTTSASAECAWVRKLPRQVDTSKVDFTGASGLDRNATGGTWPRLSWGRSVL